MEIRSTTEEHCQERLPLAALLALAMTGFICIITETLPAGLLPKMATGLHISTSLAGQTVTAYALGSMLAAIPLTIATQRWRRRNVLLLTIFGFLIFNTVTALSSNLWVTLTARFFAGLVAGLAWSLLAGYARRMVPVHQQGRALTVAMVGTPIALSFGVPVGTWMGSAIGWRSAFAAMSMLALILIIWVLVKVPDYPSKAAHERESLLRVFTIPGVRSVLCVVMVWMLAHNILYTYIAPFIAQAGLGSQIDVVLLTFGVASLIAIFMTGQLIDRHLRVTVLTCLASFAAVSVMFIWLAPVPIMVFIGVAIWGMTFGGAATLLQTALADTVGSGAEVALSMNVVAWNSAIAGGGLVGGLLLNTWGVDSFPPALTLLLAVGFYIAWSARRHGFSRGPRNPHLQEH